MWDQKTRATREGGRLREGRTYKRFIRVDRMRIGWSTDCWRCYSCVGGAMYPESLSEQTELSNITTWRVLPRKDGPPCVHSRLVAERTKGRGSMPSGSLLITVRACSSEFGSHYETPIPRQQGIKTTKPPSISCAVQYLLRSKLSMH